MSADELDGALNSRSARHPSITGDERDPQPFCQRDVCSVIRRQVLAKRPHAWEQRLVQHSFDRHLSQRDERSRRNAWADFPPTHQTSQRMRRFDVDERRRSQGFAHESAVAGDPTTAGVDKGANQD